MQKADEVVPASATNQNRRYQGKESAAYQEHFNDLCRLLGQPTPNEADPSGSDFFCFQKRVVKDVELFELHDSGEPALIRFGAEIEAILKRRPAVGPLFPYLRTVRAGDRATEFRQRCAGLKILGVSLHSYRYAWAERALKCGYPERFTFTTNNGTISITGYTGTNYDVSIPSTTNGYPVTTIVSSEFGILGPSSSVTNVTIPDSVTNIGFGAFEFFLPGAPPPDTSLSAITVDTNNSVYIRHRHVADTPTARMRNTFSPHILTK